MRKVIAIFLSVTLLLSPVQGLAITSSASAQHDSENIQIPSTIGTVEEIYHAPASDLAPKIPRLMVHIKDAHANYEAQKNIHRILNILHDKYGFQLVTVEGAAEPLDPGYLEFFSDKERNQKVADYLLRKGEISGTDLFLLDKTGMRPVGIESIDDYAANLSSYRQVLGAKEEADKLVTYFQSQLDLTMPRLLGKNLLKFVKLWEGFEIRRNELLNYVGAIGREAVSSLGIDFSKLEVQIEWPSLWRILKLKGIEGKLDAKKIQEDHERLMRDLQTWKVSNELSVEMGKLKVNETSASSPQASLDQNGMWPPRVVFERLAAEGAAHGFEFKNYPHEALYAQYLVLQSEIDPGQLFDEVNRLSDRLLAVFAKTDEEKQVISFIRDIRMFKKIYGLELLRADAASLKLNSDGWLPSKMAARLDHLKEAANVANHKIDITPWLEKLDPLMKEVLGFYELAERRDGILMNNALSAMRNGGQPRAVMITGGYHSDGILEQCKQAGISYIGISPRIRETDSDGRYVSIMMGQTDGIKVSYLAPNEVAQSGQVFALMDGADGNLAVRRRSLVLINALTKAAGPLQPGDLRTVLRHPVFREDPEATLALAASLGDDRLAGEIAEFTNQIQTERPEQWFEALDQWISSETGTFAGGPLESEPVAYLTDRLLLAGQEEAFYELTDAAIRRVESEKEPVVVYSLGRLYQLRQGLLRYKKKSLESVRQIIIRTSEALGRDRLAALGTLREIYDSPELIPDDQYLLPAYLRRLQQDDMKDVYDSLRRILDSLADVFGPYDESEFPKLPGPPEKNKQLYERLRGLESVVRRGLFWVPPRYKEEGPIAKALEGLNQRQPDFRPLLRFLRDDRFFLPTGQPSPELLRQLEQTRPVILLRRLRLKLEDTLPVDDLRAGRARLPGIAEPDIPVLARAIPQVRQLIVVAAPKRDPLPLPTLVNRVRDVFPYQSQDLLPAWQKLADFAVSPEITTPELEIQPELLQRLPEGAAIEPFNRLVIEIVRLVNSPESLKDLPPVVETEQGPVRLLDLVRIFNRLGLEIVRPLISAEQYTRLNAVLTTPIPKPLQAQFLVPIFPEFIDVINRNAGRFLPVLPGPVGLNRLTEDLRTQPVPSRAIEGLALVLTSPLIATPELTVLPEAVNLPTEVLNGLRELIPVAIGAVNRPEFPAEVRVPGIPRAVTKPELINLLNELGRVISVPDIAEIRGLTQALPALPITAETAESLVRLVTAPSIATPELTVLPEAVNLPAEVLNGLRELIPVAIVAVTSPEFPAEVRVPGIPRAVAKPELINLLNELGRVINVPSVPEITRLTQALPALPITAETAESLVRLVTVPSIATPELTVVPDLNLPAELVTALKVLLPVAIAAVNVPEFSVEVRVPGIPAAVTKPELINLLNELGRVINVPSVPEITRLTQALPALPITAETAESLVRLVTAPSIATPELTVLPEAVNLPTEVLNGLRELIPVAIGAVTRPEFPAEVRVPGVPRAVTKPELINLLNELGRVISVPSVPEIARLTEELPNLPVRVESAESLVRLVTAPSLATPEVVNLPAEVLNGLRELIPVAIAAVNRAEFPAEVRVPGVPRAVTKPELINLLNELGRVISVPSVPEITRLTQALPALPITAETAESLVRLVTAPGITTPELAVVPELNLPAEVVTALRVLIPVAVVAVNRDEFPNEVSVPNIPRPVTKAELVRLLNELGRVISVPSVPEITRLTQALPDLPVRVETAESLVRLVTAPGITTPELAVVPELNLPAEVVTALRVLIPVAVVAVNGDEFPNEVSVPNIPRPVTKPELVRLLNELGRVISVPSVPEIARLTEELPNLPVRVESAESLVKLVTAPSIATPELTVLPEAVNLPAEVLNGLRELIPVAIGAVTRPEFPAEVSVPNIPRPVTKPELVRLLNELGRVISVPDIAEIRGLTEELPNLPVRMETAESLVRLVTAPSIATPELTVLPEAVNLPAEVLNGLRELIPVAIAAVTRPEFSAEVRVPGIPRAVTKSELINLLNELGRVISVPDIAEIRGLTEELPNLPVRVETAESLVRLVTAPSIATPELTVLPEAVNLPAEVLNGLRELIPVAIAAVTRPEFPAEVSVPGIPRAVTKPELVTLLNELGRVISVPSMPEIARLAEELPNLPVRVETAESLVRLVTAPSIATPELTVLPEAVNLPAEVLNGLRELIPVAIAAVNRPEFPAEVRVPNIPRAVSKPELVNLLNEVGRVVFTPLIDRIIALANSLVPGAQTELIEPLAEFVTVTRPAVSTAPELQRFLQAVLPSSARIDSFTTAIAASLGTLNAPAPPANLPAIIRFPGGSITRTDLLTDLRRLDSLANPVPSLESAVAQLSQTVPALVAGINEVREGLDALSDIPGPAVPSQILPVNQAIASLAANVEIFSRQLAALVRIPDLAPDVRRKLDALNQLLNQVNLPNINILNTSPTPAILVNPQLPQIEQAVNAIASVVAQIPEIKGLPEFAFAPIPVNETFVSPPERFPLDRFSLPSREQAAYLVETLRRKEAETQVGPDAVVAVIRQTESVEPDFPELLRRILLREAFPDLLLPNPVLAYQTPVTPVVSEFHDIIRRTYAELLEENHTDAGTVILNFGNRMPSRRDVMTMIAPQTFYTKLYVRYVVYEGADEEQVRELADWARSRLDIKGNPVGDRFDIVIAPEDKAAKFIGRLHLLRRPGRDERTLFELLKNASPEIKNQTDFFARSVYYAAQPVLREITSLPKAAWRVFYPVGRKRFINDLPYTAVKLARAALIRDQLPEADKREFQLQPRTDLFRFVPGELLQLLSAFAANLRRLLAAA